MTWLLPSFIFTMHQDSIKTSPLAHRELRIKPGGVHLPTEKKQSAPSATEDVLLNFARSQRKLGGAGLVYSDPNQQEQFASFTAETRKRIAEYLKDVPRNEKNIRNAMIQAYIVGSRLWRIIQYFVGLNDLLYVVAPHQIEAEKIKAGNFTAHLKKTTDFLSSFGIQRTFREILTICLREDVFFGTIREIDGDILVQRLPSDCCKITSIRGDTYNVSFDFNYFSGRSESKLNFYSDEMSAKYRLFKDKGKEFRWQELDTPASFAVKCNSDIPDYAIPPFLGVLRDIFEIEDYQALKLEKAAIDNYALLVGEFGVDDGGNSNIDLKLLKEFFGNLREVVPPQIAAVAMPTPIEKISFERPNGAEHDFVTEAEEHLYNSAGVSSLLFSNTKASSNALLLSIKADQAITYSLVESIGAMLNRYLHSKPFGKNLSVKFLDISRYNRDEMTKAYLQACQFGFPFVSHYAAALGITQSEMDGLEVLENGVWGIRKRFVPLQGASTISKSGETDGAGRPTLGAGEISDNGEIAQENE